MTIIDTDTGEIIEALSMSEQNELAECEAKIERGLQTFYEVGEALLRIRKNTLYRKTHRTFEAYCRERWGFTDERARLLMRGAEVVDNLKNPTIVGVLPLSESHARPLTRLEPDQQITAWQRAVDTAPDGKITAGHVQNIVDEMQGKASPTFSDYTTEEAYYRNSPDKEPAFDYKRDAKSNRAADEYVPQGFDACQTPAYAIDPLLPYLDRSWTIWEPAAGEGLLVDALSDSNFEMIIGSDILTGSNFFEFEPDQEWDCIVTNPPFSLKYRWMERCYQLGKPFALLLPVETLGAKTAQEMFREHGIEVIFMDKRINFKMPNKGWDGGGAQFPVAWFTWGLNIGSQMTFARLNHETN